MWPSQNIWALSCQWLFFDHWQPHYSIIKSFTPISSKGHNLNRLTVLQGVSSFPKIVDFFTYTSFRYKRDNLFQYFSLMKSSENEFNFFACILADYLAHESPKEFWKNSHFENMRAVSFWGVKTHFGKLPLEMMHFQPWKKLFKTLSCVTSWSNEDFNILSTSKWPTGP